VDQISLKDQEFIYEMTKRWVLIEKKTRAQEIFIVHNYRSIKSKNELEELFNKICVLYSGDPGENRETFILYSGELRARHILIMNDDVKEGSDYNMLAFAVLRDWIKNMVIVNLRKEKWLNPFEGLRLAMTKTLPRYIDNIKDVQYESGVFKIIYDNTPVVKDSINPNVGSIDAFKPHSRSSVVGNKFKLVIEAPSLDQNSQVTIKRILQTDRPNTWILKVTGTKENNLEDGEIIEKDDLSYGFFEENYYIPIDFLQESKPSMEINNGVIIVKITKPDPWD